MKTEVQFHSTAFNCSEPKEYFINECCFGEDVARWLIQKLRDQGVKTADEPGQEDFGWYFGFTVSGVDHCMIIGFQPNNPATGDRWLGWIERPKGFLASIFGSRSSGILPEAIEAVDRALRSSPEIRGIVWNEPGHDSEAVGESRVEGE